MVLGYRSTGGLLSWRVHPPDRGGARSSPWCWSSGTGLPLKGSRLTYHERNERRPVVAQIRRGPCISSVSSNEGGDSSPSVWAGGQPTCNRRGGKVGRRVGVRRRVGKRPHRAPSRPVVPVSLSLRR